MPAPQRPKIYHIAHVDRLASIVSDGHFWCDAEILRRNSDGTTIGMGSIKQRRLTLPISCRPGLCVGDCVPFYFCPRSIMLFLIHCANNPELAYKGGQGPIVHMEFDMLDAVNWAQANNRRWAFTLSNAGARYFEDRCDLAQLGEINWDAVTTDRWSGNGISRSVKEGKQAEFLMEHSFPWSLVRRVGVRSQDVAHRVVHAMGNISHRPTVEIMRNWYY
jgi:hypothetical protein